MAHPNVVQKYQAVPGISVTQSLYTFTTNIHLLCTEIAQISVWIRYLCNTTTVFDLPITAQKRGVDNSLKLPN